MAKVELRREIQHGGTRGQKKDYRLNYEIEGFLQFLPCLCLKTHPIRFCGKEKHNAKILSIYLTKFDEKSQSYFSIKVPVKRSLGEFQRSIA